MADNKYFDGEINEFIDWISGDNSLTGENETNNLQPSGKAIRQLLLKKLKTPVCLYENKLVAKYLLFSSEEAKNIYLNASDADKSKPEIAALLLQEFDGPAAYKMVGKLLSSEKVFLTSNKLGEELIRFVWSLINSADETQQETYTNIRITIVNNGIKVWEMNEGINSNDEDHKATSNSDYTYEYWINILPHLRSGINYVNITLLSESYGASFEFNPLYNMVNFELKENEFSPYAPITNSITIIPEYLISVDADVYLNVSIDNLNVFQASAENRKQHTFDVSALTPGEHVLVMYLYALILGIEYRSNVICKQFVKTIVDSSDYNAYLAISFDFENNSSEALTSYKNKEYNLSLLLYSLISIPWGVSAYDTGTVYSKVNFYLSDSASELSNEELISEIPEVDVNRKASAPIEYAPKNTFSEKYLGYTIGSSTVFHKIACITVKEFVYASYIHETPSFSFKYDAYGKNNATDNKWRPDPASSVINIGCTTTGVAFSLTNGWYKNSFRTKGIGSYMEFTDVPFLTSLIRDKFTFEIDFMTEYTSHTDDLLVNVGEFLKIYPNRAQLIDTNDAKIIETNFKAGERVHLTFIKYPRTLEDSLWNNLYMIITNGIFERADSPAANIKAVSQTIKIGGSNSGIRVFGMRYYTQNLDWAACYNNWIYDSDNKADLVLRNMVFFTTGSDIGEISETKCDGMMDTILIEGDLMLLVNKGVKLGMRVDSLKRLCPTDSTKNFTIYDCWVRTHGQSNIKYPVPSFKIWSNKSDDPEGSTPRLELSKITLQFCKSRMLVYNGAVPANKWVLLSNFADSSCAHNGTFLRKWNDLTYNARFDVGGKIEYKLRTPPQLFTSGETITPLDNNQVTDNMCSHGKNEVGKQWKDYTNAPFPYQLRLAPNSFPALLFFRANPSDQWTFFGQYVFMDDKKNDSEYGERSIYQGFGDDTDPFVMCRRNIPQSDKNPDGMRPEGSPKYDSKNYRIWDNKNVIRIEVLDVDGNEVNFINEPQGCQQGAYWTVWDSVRANRTANTSFEIIYPDIDDMDDTEVNAIYAKWQDFCRWVVSTKNNLPKFLQEAAAHLDLYKMAAYYTFFLVFGLVDSVNRNALWKTYDGLHWWIEPWDMDIALGRKNDGGIAYDPPIDRQTPSPAGDVGAFSGKDSVLWNHLEAYPYWMNTIVPAVVLALYEAGMTYDNMVDMLDNEYSLRWPEYIYNKSGEYKYIYSGIKDYYVEPGYLQYLLGASIMHRHWWLSTSMDYWFSRFGRGAFTANYIKVDTNIPASNLGVNILIIPSQKAFFGYYFQEGGSPSFTEQGYDQQGLINVGFNIKESFSTKKPFFICGLTNMEELDLHELGAGFSSINLNKETEIHSIKVGCIPNNGRLSYINSQPATFFEFPRAINIQKVDVTGQYKLSLFSVPPTLTHLYAAASNFLTGVLATGNAFKVLHIPNLHIDNHDNKVYTLLSLNLTDCSWDELKFFDTTNDAEQHDEAVPDPEGGEPTHRIYYEGNIAEAVELKVLQIALKGTTCSGINANKSRDLIMNWIFGTYANTLTTQEKLEALTLDHVEWYGVTKQLLLQLAQFYRKENTEYHIVPNMSGKITLDSNEVINTTDLANFLTWFGDSVFTLGTSGIVIDYPNPVAVISVGNPAVFDTDHYNINEADTSDVTGVSIGISYVKFYLEQGGQELSWLFGVPNGQGGWVWDNYHPGSFNNVSINGVFDPQTERWRYVLKIKESPLNQTEPYEFKIKVEGFDESVLFRVTPATHTASLQIDSSSSLAIVSNGTLLIRATNSVAKINALIGGTSQIPPILEWSLSGVAQNFLSMVEVLDGNSVLLTPTETVTSTAQTGTLNCKVNYPSVGVYINILMPIYILEDQCIVDNTNTSLRSALNEAMGTSLTEIYQSDVLNITSLTLNGILRYGTKTNDPIFKFLTNCLTLTIAGGESINNIQSYLASQYMPALRTLIIEDQVDFDIDLTQTNVVSFTSRHLNLTESNVGIIASGNISLVLDAPRKLLLSTINGSLQIASTNNLAIINILNDTNMTYPSLSGWLGLIPSTTNKLTSLSLTNIRGCLVSNNQQELSNLANNNRVTISAFLQVLTINVPGYYKYYADLIPELIYGLCLFGEDYYVLYNHLNDASKSFYDAWLTWLDDNYLLLGKVNSNPRYGSKQLGWTKKSLQECSAPNLTNGISLDMAGVTAVKFDVYQDRNNHGMENVINIYLMNYNEYDFSATSIDPELELSNRTTSVLLGNPASITVKGALDSMNTAVCHINLSDTSNLLSVNVETIFSPFITVFSWGKTANLSGTIKGSETIIGDNNILRNGLIAAENNNLLVLSGSIVANDIYMYQEDIDAINSRFGTGFLTCLVAIKAVDAAMQQAFSYLGIRNLSDLNGYRWKTFWQAVYNAMPNSATKNDDFTNLCNSVVYAPEVCYMTATLPSNAYDLDLYLNISGLTEPTFSSLRLICYAAPGSIGGTGIFNISQNNGAEIPSGWGPHILKSSNATLDGVFMIHGGLTIRRWSDNEKIYLNYALFVNGAYGSLLSNSSLYLAYHEQFTGNNDFTYCNEGSKYNRTNFKTLQNAAKWPFYIYNMMTADPNSGHTLEDWWAGNYDYSELDFQ